MNVPPGMSGGGGSPGPPPGLSVSPNLQPNPSPNNNAGGVSPGQQQASGQGSTFGSPIHGFVQPQLFPQPSLGPPSSSGGMGSQHQQYHQHQQHSNNTSNSNPNSSGSVSTIVKAQIVFLLSTLTEDAWERNVSEIRTLISQNAPEMYHHFLRRLIVNAAPVLQALQSQAAGMQQGQQGVGMVQGDRPLTASLSVPQNGPGVLAWRVLVSEGVRAARDSNLGESRLEWEDGRTATSHLTLSSVPSSFSPAFRIDLARPRPSVHPTRHQLELASTRPHAALFIRMQRARLARSDAFGRHARPGLRDH